MLQCRPYFRNATSVFHRLRTINLAGNGRQPRFLAGWRLRFSRQSGLYYAAAVCLLAAAVALRFYNLAEHSLSYDEAVAAFNARGSFAELIHNTRHDNSSPILYPAALWLAQKAASTEFSIRMLPAAASALTVAAMLFVLPRVGVGRRAALLGALLATVSTAAIEQAQDGREYSIDALLATLLTAGLLWYLRDGKRGLLGACLFIAPLLQYGLVLFVGAVIAVAAVGAPPGLPDPSRRLLRGRVGAWLQRRAGLVGAVGAFLAGCAITYAVTLRYHWSGSGWYNEEGQYLYEYYYQGGYDAAAALEFAASRTWELLGYHLPVATAALALGAFGILLLASLQRRRCNALALLAILAVAIAVGAAMLGQYPLGAIRQLIYLGPVIFLAAGLALGSLGANLTGLARWNRGYGRRRRQHPFSAFLTLGSRALGNRFLLPGLAAGVIVGAGTADLRADSPYWTYENYHAISAALEERVPAGDMVYVIGRVVPPMRFYREYRTGTYYYDTFGSGCWRIPDCSRARADVIVRLVGSDNRNRIWLIDNRYQMAKELNRRADQIAMKAFVAHGRYQLYLITTPEERRAEYRTVVSGYPASHATFDLYPDGDRLYYAKEPCAPADTAAVFLYLFAANADDLPKRSRRHGFADASFPFDRYGARFDGKCLISVPLPEYPIERIRTGQYDDGGQLWAAEFVPGMTVAERLAEYRAVASGAPLARGVFDVYHNAGRLYYVREPCVPADTAAAFFLHIAPADVGDLPDDRRQHGYDNRDFHFAGAGGALFDGKCLVSVPLPEYPIVHIRTGQYDDGGQLWAAELVPGRR